MGLLNYLTAHSLDEDYAHVAKRDGGTPEPKPPRAGLAALVILGLFGLLVATAAVQTSRNAVDEADGNERLATQLTARSAQVDARRNRVTDLREEVEQLNTEFLAATTQGRQLTARLSRLAVRTGAAAVTGPGVRVVVDDNPDAVDSSQRILDKDLQKLANALWESGAEAISVNGLRLSNLSAIRHAGSAITVNGRSLSAPYTVLAVGDRDSIPARFVETSHGSAWLDYQTTYGLEFEMTTEAALTLPAANDLNLRFVRTPGERP
jgi:uncharacterized protein YlxW (UPF0749 family)